MRLIKRLLHFVFPKKKNDIMIADFIENALVIDDKPSDVSNLISVLENKGVAVTYFEPDKIKGQTVLKNRKVIFLDLYLDKTSTELKGHIAKIRKILKERIGKNFGTYGIVLWSAHTDEIEQLQEKIQIDKNNNEYAQPLFLVGLDKTKYIRNGGDYTSLFADINTALQQDPSATFFMEWYNSVKLAQDNTISKIYSLIPDYQERGNDFLYILKKMAMNHTGIPDGQLNGYPLHIDAFKAFDDILHAELINCQKSGSNIFSNRLKAFSKQNDLPNIYAHINTAILIDENNIDQNLVIPGNVYEIKSPNSSFKTDKAPQNAKNVVIEITPPCDFSNNGKRIRARLIGGFLIDAESDTGKLQTQIEKLKCKKDCFYSEIYPIIVPNFPVPQILILDFRYFGAEEDANLKISQKYKILFRAKPKLFADIIQKFSSHAARLGLSVIHPSLNN